MHEAYHLKNEILCQPTMSVFYASSTAMFLILQYQYQGDIQDGHG
jgi:hypothetical protein